MAGKLEIRVVPKEPTVPRDPPPAQRPQTLSPPAKQPPPPPSSTQTNPDETKTNHTTPQPSEPPKIKLERTKSILKQSSKERSEHPELHSPKRENITFAPDCVKLLQEKESRKLLEKKVSLEKIEVVNSVKKNNEEVSESSSESSSSESEDDDDDDGEEEEKSKSDLKRSNSSPIRRISITRSSSRINFEPLEQLAAQKHLPKPAIEKIRRSLLESRSDSTSESRSVDQQQQQQRKDNGDNKKCAGAKNFLKTTTTPPDGRQCTPSIEVTTSNPAVTTTTMTTCAQEQR